MGSLLVLKPWLEYDALVVSQWGFWPRLLEGYWGIRPRLLFLQLHNDTVLLLHKLSHFWNLLRGRLLSNLVLKLLNLEFQLFLLWKQFLKHLVLLRNLCLYVRKLCSQFGYFLLQGCSLLQVNRKLNRWLLLLLLKDLLIDLRKVGHRVYILRWMIYFLKRILIKNSAI